MRKHTVLRWISLSFCENRRNLRIVFPLFVVAATSAPLSADEPYQAAKDDAAVRTFLAGQYQGKFGSKVPRRSRARSGECLLRSHYSISASPSQLPQPKKAELISGDDGRVEGGTVAAVAGAESMNQGLMKVAGTADATTAGAAIMSLTFGPAGPMAIPPGDVRVARLGGGWYCLATPGPPAPSGSGWP